jgi:plasmid replication initiation protein
VEKNYLVTKSNYFIMNSSYDLSLEEQKIILTLASMVQPMDEGFKSYKFKIADFMELLGVDTKTKYTEIPKITKELMKKVFEIQEGDTTIQVAWLSSATYKKGSGTVELEFSPRLKPYMLKLNNVFTQYKLANILNMKSKYSIRIYEILKCNAFKEQKCIEIEIDDLRKLLKTENTYPRYYDFRRFIIEATQKELKALTDLSFDFEEIRYGRKVTALKFYIHSNTEKKIPAINKPMPGQIDMTEVLNSEGATIDEEVTDNMITEKDLIELKAIFTNHDISNQAICSIYEDSNKDIERVRMCYSSCLDSKSKIENVVGYMRNLVKAYEPPQKQAAAKLAKNSDEIKKLEKIRESLKNEFDEKLWPVE